jgi:hypothetical protein
MEVKDKIFSLHQNFHDHKDSKGIGLYLVTTTLRVAADRSAWKVK